MLLFFTAVILLLANPILGVIYHLNESEYHRMPPLFNLDDYENCFEKRDSVYCTVHFAAVSDKSSELLTMMQEYSDHYVTHYNHTRFHYGVCVTRKCENYLKDKTGVLSEVLEGCLNETFWKHYKLKTKVTKYNCEELDDRIPIDASDIVVATAIFIIIAVNFAGSLFEVSTSDWKGKEILQCFSIKRRWKELISVNGNSGRQSTLRAFNGIKALILIFVILCHCLYPCAVSSVNSLEIEKIYHYMFYRALMSSPIVMHAEFFMSGFFLMHKLKRYSETNGFNFSIFPKALIWRCLRIMPSYAVVIGIVATWLRRIGSGPLWERALMKPANDCRQNWWLHLLFMNNFIYGSECMAHTWYIAADTQVYIVGLLICILSSNDGTRRRNLVLLYIIGIIIPPTITYLLDLDGQILFTPERNLVIFKDDPTFHELYVPGYTNMAASALGLLMGDLYYRWRLNQVSLDRVKKYQTYYPLKWLLMASLLAMIASAQFLYRDAPRDPLYIRVLYSLIAPPLFTILFSMMIFTILLRIDNTYTRFFEWNGWVIPSRLSYSTFLVHFAVTRVITATQTSLVLMSTSYLVATFFKVVVMSFALAIPLWLLVEAPFIELVNLYLAPKQEQKNSKPNVKGNDHKIEDRKND